MTTETTEERIRKQFPGDWPTHAIGTVAECLDAFQAMPDPETMREALRVVREAQQAEDLDPELSVRLHAHERLLKASLEYWQRVLKLMAEEAQEAQEKALLRMVSEA